MRPSVDLVYRAKECSFSKVYYSFNRVHIYCCQRIVRASVSFKSLYGLETESMRSLNKFISVLEQMFHNSQPYITFVKALHVAYIYIEFSLSYFLIFAILVSLFRLFTIVVSCFRCFDLCVSRDGPNGTP